MVTDSYSKMIAEVGMRSMLQGNDELGMLMREKRRQQAVNSDLEREINMYRSDSAPPTVEGSLNAVGGLFGGGGAADFGGLSDEELRSDPSYISYYYSNINLNPRLPPPLLSKEDWRFMQRFQSTGGGSSAIGDKRKVSTVGDIDVGNNKSLFSVQLGFGGNREEISGSIESRKTQGVAGDWGGDGLIGLQGLGLGSRQKSIADIIQDNASPVTSLSRSPSRPASRNAFEDNMESTESLRSGANSQSMLSGSHTYASALGASLSRSTTPDLQVLARVPSPRIPSVCVGRVSSLDKRSANRPNSFSVRPAGITDPMDLAAALSGISLSTNGVVDEQQSFDEHQSMFHLQGDSNSAKHYPYLNKSESGKLHLNSVSQQVKGSYPDMGNKGGELVVDPSNSSLLIDGEIYKSANLYLTGPSTPILGSGGSPPSRFQSAVSPNSSLQGYGLSGYASNPASPSMLANQFGSINLPPLFENAAAAMAMSMSGMDSRVMGGGFALGPNVIADAAELQNFRNHSSGGALQKSVVDPLYLQYLRSNEYAATALNDPTMDREALANSYMDLLAQKAYLAGQGSLLSPQTPQKSQYGLPYLGKSSTLNHGFYANSPYGLGLSYAGSPLAGPFLHNSTIVSGGSVRHGERNLQFPKYLGSWHAEPGGTLNDGFPASLLDEFKSNKTKCFELLEIAGHVVEFSADQYGSRFIQQKLETATMEEKNMVFHEIMPQALSLMTDVFGNYVIQKFFEHGTAPQIRELADQLTGHVLTLSLQMYGCRVIQKAIEVVDLDQQTKMVAELDGHVLRCVRDQNGNHVIQKCIECIPEDAIHFIVSTFYDQVVTLSTHPYGCRVIQRVLEHCSDPITQSVVMDEILQRVCMLAQDQYGNYVVQHVLEHGKPHERTAIISQLIGQIVQMSQQKFASNVVEKCLTFGTPEEHHVLVTEMLGSTDENEPLQVMMKDQFANYVVQKVLETCDDNQLELILNRIKVHLNALKKYTYGKHIVARVEKLVAAGERRISILASYSAAS